MYTNSVGNPSELGGKNVKESLHTKHTNKMYNGTLLPKKTRRDRDESIGEDVASTNAYLLVRPTRFIQQIYFAVSLESSTLAWPSLASIFFTLRYWLRLAQTHL